MTSIDNLIAGPQFQLTYLEKKQVLLPLLQERARRSAENNEQIRKHAREHGYPGLLIDDYEDLPFLPVSMFKEFDLATVPREAVVRTLLSSSTTSGTPSRIPLDKLTARRQSQGLAAILKDILGIRRRPFLVLDCAEINRPGHQLTARGAAVRGMMPFASETCYALVQTEKGLEPSIEALERFFADHAGREVLLFGFTFMVWTNVICKLRRLGIRFHHPQMTLLHSGGWKKLTEQQVDKKVLSAGATEIFGCDDNRVRDFYGMVEQVGVVFVDCEAGHKHTPAFAEVAIRDLQSLRQVEIGDSGLIQVMSLLPESYPGHALITEDIGQLLGYDDCPCGRKGLYFRFRSRVQQVEVRGCGDTVATTRPISAPIRPSVTDASSVPVSIAWLAGRCPSSAEALGDPFQALRAQFLNGSSLTDIPSAAIIGLLDNAAQQMLCPNNRDIEGVAFLSAWLRRSNLERVLDTNLGSKRPALDRPLIDTTGELRAVPRGVVGHWVAGNVPTLAVFSWVLSTLAKNANIVRVSEASVHAVQRLFQSIATARFEWQGRELTGEALLAHTSVLHFPSTATQFNRNLSLACDVRIIWGSGQTVQAVRALDCLEHCEDLVFGPKFSLAVADREMLRNPSGRRELARNLSRDVATFEQAACSSPQVLFLEGTIAEHVCLLEELHDALAEQQRRSPRRSISETTAALILRQRALYGLMPGRRVLASAGTEHSILAADGAELTAAVQARTLFVQGVDQLEDCLSLLSPKIQTLGMAIKDPALYAHVAEEAARRGVSRCVPLGAMNYFETPWDGMLPVSRLVRWVKMSAEKKTHDRLCSA